MTKEDFQTNINRILERDNSEKYPFDHNLGLKLVDCEFGKFPKAFFSYKGKDHHRNPYGGIHGGIVSSLADTATGTCTIALTNKYTTTVDLSVNYLRPLFGDEFVIEVEFTHIGKRIVSSYVKMIDSDREELCATAILNFMLLENLNTNELRFTN